ncbi:MAG: class I SAM-dependent methyltransferase [Nitrospirales bacterium]
MELRARRGVVRGIVGKWLGLALAAGLCLGLAQCAPHHHGAGHHRRPTDIQDYLRHLDSAERDQYQKPEEVVAALQLQSGMRVADLGAGSGYFTRRLARAVTESGKVYAIDVEPDMLAYTQKSVEGMGAPASVEYLLAEPDSPGLPDGSVDLIFLCNVYHHLENRTQYFARVGRALRPGGRVVIIDFYTDQRSGDVGFPRRHLVAQDTVRSELGRAGYRLLREHHFLPRQYFLEFSPPAS